MRYSTHSTVSNFELSPVLLFGTVQFDFGAQSIENTKNTINELIRVPINILFSY